MPGTRVLNHRIWITDWQSSFFYCFELRDRLFFQHARGAYRLPALVLCLLICLVEAHRFEDFSPHCFQSLYVVQISACLTPSSLHDVRTGMFQIGAKLLFPQEAGRGNVRRPRLATMPLSHYTGRMAPMRSLENAEGRRGLAWSETCTPNDGNVVCPAQCRALLLFSPPIWSSKHRAALFFRGIDSPRRQAENVFGRRPDQDIEPCPDLVVLLKGPYSAVTSPCLSDAATNIESSDGVPVDRSG